MSTRQMWNDRYTKKDLVWSAGPNELFATEIRNLKPGKAVDVACGEGRNAIWLAEQEWNVMAIDFSDVAIAKGRRIAAKRDVNVNWITEDVSTWKLPKYEFDLVAVLYLHTTIRERELWLKNVIDSVKPSGTFIYIAHDSDNIENGVGGPQDPALLPTMAEITNALKGFDVEIAEVIERPVSRDPGHGKELEGIALDSFVRALRT
ncbi:MAG: class I SAM-dependent methyltransferase [Gammaproteobacteria bacterium]|nr:class I SAM-dependent methyltransferase [Gammaproteobacteria bacterium]